MASMRCCSKLFSNLTNIKITVKNIIFSMLVEHRIWRIYYCFSSLKKTVWQKLRKLNISLAYLDLNCLTFLNSVFTFSTRLKLLSSYCVFLTQFQGASLMSLHSTHKHRVEFTILKVRFLFLYLQLLQKGLKCLFAALLVFTITGDSGSTCWPGNVTSHWRGGWKVQL